MEVKLLGVLERSLEAFAWSIEDIKGIGPSTCMHKILMEEDHAPSIKHQRWLNSIMKEVVKKEVLKWLQVGLMYAISDSPWVSLVQCVPKKGGMHVVRNEKNELLSTRTITGWRVCIDYRSQQGNCEGSLSSPFPGSNARSTCGTLSLLLPRWLFRIQPDHGEPRRPRENNLQVSIWEFSFKRMSFGFFNEPTTF